MPQNNPPVFLIFFGLPGAGKTFAARAIARELGLFFHDGDDDLLEVMRAAIAASLPITDAMRDEFFRRLIDHIRLLRLEQPSLAVAQTFIQEKYRRWVLNTFPEAHFILVEADEAVRERRLARRTTGSHVAPDYARGMATLFEPPSIPHTTLRNDRDGNAGLIAWARSLSHHD
jgi:gluconokinase